MKDWNFSLVKCTSLKLHAWEFPVPSALQFASPVRHWKVLNITGLRAVDRKQMAECCLLSFLVEPGSGLPIKTDFLERLWVKYYTRLYEITVYYITIDFLWFLFISLQSTKERWAKRLGRDRKRGLLVSGNRSSNFQGTTIQPSNSKQTVKSNEFLITHHANGCNSSTHDSLTFQKQRQDSAMKYQLNWLDYTHWSAWKVIYSWVCKVKHRSMASGKQVLSACVIVHRSS